MIHGEEDQGIPLVPDQNGYAPVDQVDILYDLASDPAHLYVGYGTQGANTMNPEWTIRRIAITGGAPTTSQWTAKGAAIWANRTTETYL